MELFDQMKKGKRFSKREMDEIFFLQKREIERDLSSVGFLIKDDEALIKQSLSGLFQRINQFDSLTSYTELSENDNYVYTLDLKGL